MTKPERSRPSRIEVSLLAGCNPPLCADITARIIKIAVRATADIQPQAKGAFFHDHEQKINKRVKDLLEEKLKDDFDWKQLIKLECGDKCRCKIVHEVELDPQLKGQPLDYESDVTVYVDKDGKIDTNGKPHDSGTANIACTVLYKVTIVMEYRGKIGMCLPGAQSKWL
jgi:hypothetical protein